MQGTAGFSRFMELMRTEPEIKDAPDAVELTDVKGAVEYRDVGFRYDEGKPWVLRDINFEDKPRAKSSLLWGRAAAARRRYASCSSASTT